MNSTVYSCSVACTRAVTVTRDGSVRPREPRPLRPGRAAPPDGGCQCQHGGLTGVPHAVLRRTHGLLGLSGALEQVWTVAGRAEGPGEGGRKSVWTWSAHGFEVGQAPETRKGIRQ